MTSHDDVLDPARVAHASIEGYLYQAWLGVERWLGLSENEILRCEGDEDLDVLLRSGPGGRSEQVKALTRGINIRDEVIQETLRRFAVSHHRLLTLGPPELRQFVFTSTASLRTQRIDDDFEVDVLKVWEQAKTNEGDRARVVKALRKALPLSKPDMKYKNQLIFWKQLEDALAWLEVDIERWADFIRSIEWNLGEPELTEIRKRIAMKLYQLLPGAPPGLDQRLLGEVLDASIEREPRNRCRTREDLGKILDQAHVEVAQWLRNGGDRLVAVIQALDRLRLVLYKNRKDLDRDLEGLNRPPRPGELLTASYEVIPFDETGRVALLEDLAEWCSRKDPVLVRLIHGDGGLGKTRLLIEWCRRLSAQGWVTGFLESRTTDRTALFEGNLPRLIVIDYAETRFETVRALLDQLAHLDSAPRIRLVLLARRAGEWWTSLASGDAADKFVQILLEKSTPVPLEPLDLQENAREGVFRQAALAFAARQGKALPHPLPEPNLADIRFGRPLFLHMAALAAVDGCAVADAQEALAEALKKEHRYWRTDIEETWVDPSDRRDLIAGMKSSVAVLTLLAGLPDENTLKDLARQVLPSDTRRATADELAERVRDLYAAPQGSSRHIGGLEPDLLGEELVWDVLCTGIQPLRTALDLADPEGARQILTVLTRLAQRPERTTEAKAWLAHSFEAKLENLAEPALEVAVALGDPIGEVLAQALQNTASLELARRIMNRCDGEDLRHSVPLREVALHSTKRVYEVLGAQQSQTEDGKTKEKYRGDLARVASSLGVRLNALGRRGEAFQANQEAANLYRRLTQQSDDFKSDLARSLNNLGFSLSELGRSEEALLVTQEAADIRRLLAQQSSNAFKADLAASLNNLGLWFGALRRHEEALQVLQEAVEIRRLLAQQQPEIFKDLARSLHNLGLTFNKLDRGTEALKATEEAVKIRRLLAQQRPDVFSPDLASSLSNLGSDLCEIGLLDDAIRATQESVEIRRLLAHQRPEAFSPSLAESLGNLAFLLSASGNSRAALEAAEDGVRILKPVFLRDPQVLGVRMRRILYSYEKRCLELGRQPNQELVGPVKDTLTTLL